MICSVAVEFLGSCEVALDPVTFVEDDGAADVEKDVCKDQGKQISPVRASYGEGLPGLVIQEGH